MAGNSVVNFHRLGSGRGLTKPSRVSGKASAHRQVGADTSEGSRWSAPGRADPKVASRSDVKMAGYVWRILYIGPSPRSAQPGLIERQDGWALAARHLAAPWP